MATRALIIDDDVRLFELLSRYLSQNGIQATHARDGLEGLRELETAAHDIVVLDIMMPGIDGLEVLSRLRRKSSIPVIMLTAKGDETDRVVGLELGADDYVAKPFSPRELVARIRALMRRTQPLQSDERLTVEDLIVNVATREVTRSGERVELTGLEFDILLALLRRAGRVIPRAALLEEAGRGDVSVGERTVDVHVSRLRKKLGDDSRARKLIKTVRGVGYVLTRGED